MCLSILQAVRGLWERPTKKYYGPVPTTASTCSWHNRLCASPPRFSDRIICVEGGRVCG